MAAFTSISGDKYDIQLKELVSDCTISWKMPYVALLQFLRRLEILVAGNFPETAVCENKSIESKIASER